MTLPKKTKITADKLFDILHEKHKEHGFTSSELLLENLIVNNENLRNFNFCGFHIVNVSFDHCNLGNANFTNCFFQNVSFKDISGINMLFVLATIDGKVSFKDANLSGANFKHSGFRSCEFKNSSLDDANFKYANLSNADLSGVSAAGTNLEYTTLWECNMCGADLSTAILTGISYLETINIDNKTKLPRSKVPLTGQFTAWKKVRSEKNNSYAILKLRVLPKANRVSALVSNKCRVEYARVISAEDLKGNLLKETNFKSMYTSDFKYKVGKIVRANQFSDSNLKECTSGIHCFLNKEEAITYNP